MYQDSVNFEEYSVAKETNTAETALTEAQYLYEMQLTLNFFGAGRMDELF
ncbi:hypothetical protein [Acidaminobacter hydrogenoformans]|jgi:hypothetical protein|uniref:Uncharacterized protein n=1 Tax=Acidaminobacter hydrogenoformans DSM 2784 TaxID=1120920 RepID=A0A1G5RW97_9FIRM|nr:hypothetical protein [Acidaminobacter hydrogenoformans]SCZ77721.1 hypothetical protein SAMN03080599_00913 [Acidaminobacter hydrogenoformans DSM 2784]